MKHQIKIISLGSTNREGEWGPIVKQVIAIEQGSKLILLGEKELKDLEKAMGAKFIENRGS